jgi:uncharacterized membrane protein YhaH (DUF805 family)
MEHFLDAFRKYATFEGRASRKSFWMYILVYLIIAFFVGFIDGFIGADGILISILWIAFTLPSISICVRRLHDINKSGWWYFIQLIPILGTIILIIFFVSNSVNEGNRFGPSDESNSPIPSSKHKRKYDEAVQSTHSAVIADSHLYKMATDEFENNKDEALWAKAIVVCEGDVEKAKYFYIKAKVRTLQSNENTPTLL